MVGMADVKAILGKDMAFDRGVHRMLVDDHSSCMDCATQETEEDPGAVAGIGGIPDVVSTDVA